MKNKFSKIIVFVLITSVLFIYSSCSKRKNDVGEGQHGVVAPIEWEKYDELVKQIQVESNMDKRIKMMHQAEDMIMETWAMLPLFYERKVALVDTNIEGLFAYPTGHPMFQYAYSPTHPEHLKIKAIVEPKNLSHLLLSTFDNGILGDCCYSNLFGYDEKGNYVSEDAVSYHISDDGLVYTIKLRNDLKWSDGSKLTAKDYADTWRWAAADITGSEQQNMFDPIAGYPNNLDVVAVDDLTLRVRLKTPCAYFLELMTTSNYAPVKMSQVLSAKGYKNGKGEVVNPAAYAQTADIISNGAFVFSQWNHNDSIVLEKNPYYYNADKIKTQKISFMLTSDVAILLTAYENDDLQIYWAPSAQTLSYYNDEPDYVRYYDCPNYTSFAFNVKDELFESMTIEQACKFRQAVSYLIDRDFIVHVALQNTAVAANSLIPPMTKDGKNGEFKQNSELYTYPFADELGYFPIKRDVEKARQLLKEVGYKFNSNGKLDDPIVFDYKFNNGGANNIIAECIQQDLAEIGIRLKTTTSEWAQFIAEKHKGQFESCRSNWNLDFCDPINVFLLFNSDSRLNEPQFGR